jgi:hypothetical protein
MIRLVKSRRIYGRGMEMKNAYKILVWKLRRRWKDNIKINLKETGRTNVDWLRVTPDKCFDSIKGREFLD